MEWGMGFTHVLVNFLNAIGNSSSSDFSLYVFSAKDIYHLCYPYHLEDA